MSRRTIACCLPVFAAVLLAGVWQWMHPAPARAADENTTALLGKPAPQITLTMLDGKSFSLAEQKGNVVVLDWWATWCPPCKASLPHLNAVSSNKDLAAKGLKVLAVNAQETKEKAADFLTKNNLGLEVPLDVDGKAATEYLVIGYPTTVIVGRDGVIKHVILGFEGEKTEKELDEAIAAALAEKK